MCLSITMSEEAREGKYIKLKLSIFKKAQLRAVSADKALGEWMEEVREEKEEGEKK